MNTVFPVRLKQARKMRRFSMDELCVAANNVVTKQSICKYESGTAFPDSSVLIALANALNISIDYFFQPATVSITNIEFRKKSSLGKKDEEAIKEIARNKLECYLEIESLNSINPASVLPDNPVCVESEEDVYSIVEQLKRKWQLGEDGINKVVDMLEENGVKVIEIEHDDSFDGLCGLANGCIPVIVLNKGFTSERKRFTALHELGHLYLQQFSCAIDKKGKENLCNLFASEMLISQNVFTRKIGERRGDISLQELIDLQIQFGISIDALMYKARQLNVITEQRYKSYNKKKNAVPDFKREVEASRSKEETSSRYDRLVYRALASGIISISKASALLSKPVETIRHELYLV